jgi:hypothetical protein
MAAAYWVFNVHPYLLLEHPVREIWKETASVGDFRTGAYVIRIRFLNRGVRHIRELSGYRRPIGIGSNGKWCRQGYLTAAGHAPSPRVDSGCE